MTDKNRGGIFRVLKELQQAFGVTNIYDISLAQSNFQGQEELQYSGSTQ